MATIKVAFYGCGGIARYHQGNLKEVPDVSIIGGYDLSAESMNTFKANLAAGDQAGFKTVTKAEELLALKPDVIYVCTPPFARGDFEVAAARQKIHLFLEKPIALSMDVANRIAAAIRENGVMMSSGYSLRYNTVYRQLAKAVEGRKVSLAHVTRWNKLIPVPWWGDRAKSGGQMTEMTTHQVDFLLMVLGDATDVFGMEHNGIHGENVTIPDSQAALVRFASGAIASITTSNGLHGQKGKNDVEFICNDVWIALQGGEIKTDPEIKLPEPETFPTVDAAFIQAIRSKNPAPIESTLDRALKALELTLRISDMGKSIDRRTEIGMMSACVEGKGWEEKFQATRALGLDFMEAALSPEEAEAIATGKGGPLTSELESLSKKYN
ncbi:MAG TPA: Gfo/Idh/MocA family oxidoreductase, partial [Planctomycetota bacterium]|nr:Gfo/Idh/MocA family oxidoreductase [Planctomycetota bacterium]